MEIVQGPRGKGQEADEEQDIVPVLICRDLHRRDRAMGVQAGPEAEAAAGDEIDFTLPVSPADGAVHGIGTGNTMAARIRQSLSQRAVNRNSTT